MNESLLSNIVIRSNKFIYYIYLTRLNTKFDVCMVAVTKIAIFWSVTYSLVDHFRETYCMCSEDSRQKAVGISELSIMIYQTKKHIPSDSTIRRLILFIFCVAYVDRSLHRSLVKKHIINIFGYFPTLNK